jgi:hypothetical protein
MSNRVSLADQKRVNTLSGIPPVDLLIPSNSHSHSLHYFSHSPSSPSFLPSLPLSLSLTSPSHSFPKAVPMSSTDFSPSPDHTSHTGSLCSPSSWASSEKECHRESQDKFVSRRDQCRCVSSGCSCSGGLFGGTFWCRRLV